MFKRRKRTSIVDQTLIDKISAYIEDALNPKPKDDSVKFSRDLSAAEDDIRYSRKDLDNRMADLVRYMEMGDQEPTFTEELLYRMDQQNYSASTCYKKAHIDRKLFSQIQKDKNYKPKKTTAIAFALALELDMIQTKSLLQYAGFALAQNNTFDLIIQYCVEHKIYDIDDVNDILYQFGQPTLGSK